MFHFHSAITLKYFELKAGAAKKTWNSNTFWFEIILSLKYKVDLSRLDLPKNKYKVYQCQILLEKFSSWNF